MLETIQTAIFDLFQNDPWILTNSPSNFLGVKRCKNAVSYGGSDATQEPAQGYVNLYDWPFESADNTKRPAVYCGMKGYESLDSPDTKMPCVNGNLMNFKIGRIPIVIVTDDINRHTARVQKNQLKKSIQEILLKTANIQSNLWWLITLDTPAQFRGVNTGGGVSQVTQSQVDFVIEVHYGELRGNLLP